MSPEARPGRCLLWCYLATAAARPDCRDRRGTRRPALVDGAPSGRSVRRVRRRRPAMITGWAAGRDVDAVGSRCRPIGPGRPSSGGGCGRRWTCRTRRSGSASRPPYAFGARAHDLPERLSVFGATRLDPDHLPCWPRSPSTATSTCGCRTPRPCCGGLQQLASAAAGPHPADRRRRPTDRLPSTAAGLPRPRYPRAADRPGTVAQAPPTALSRAGRRPASACWPAAGRHRR